MSGKIKQKASANALDNATLTTNEKILKECYQLYADENNGLVQLAAILDLPQDQLLAPRRKISVMLIGNHSAGKSSFVNWYIEEHVQRTGVAIETQGFAFVTSGRKRDSLTGAATLHLYPHFQALTEIPGLVDYLSTEISCSKQKKFSLVTFVDTPGLVDGGMKYPFDVDEAIQWFGSMCDLIFVFFDPIGQALCKRTLNIVEALNERHGDKLRFYLSKADEAGHESDRQRVMMQIVQELCKRPGLNKTCFDMPTIYIPNPNKTVRCVNQIEAACKDIEKAIDQTIQNTLNQLGRDCERIVARCESKLSTDVWHSQQNLRARCRRYLFTACGLLSLALPVLCLVTHLLTAASITSPGNGPRELMRDVLGTSAATATAVNLYLEPLWRAWSALSDTHRIYAIISGCCLSALLLLLARCTTRIRPRLSKREKRRLAEQMDYVKKVVMTKRQSMYKEYLQQSAGDFSDL